MSWSISKYASMCSGQPALTLKLTLFETGGWTRDLQRPSPGSFFHDSMHV